MSIVLARIDSRLFHGQVIEGWIPETDASVVIVADDMVASNPLQKRVMEMSAPENIRIIVEGVEDAVEDMCGHTFDDERVLLLFSSPHDACSAIKKGLRLLSVNIGNICCAEGRHQLTASIALNEEDVSDLQDLVDMGVSIDIRSIPRDRPEIIDNLFSMYFESCKRGS